MQMLAERDTWQGKLAQGADLLVHDAHFATMEERNMFSDWGHSAWYEAAQVALEPNGRMMAML